MVRGIGMGFSFVVSRVGSITAPFMLQAAGAHAPIVFGLAAFASGWMALLLPESRGKPLPESMADGEKNPVHCCSA